jgi:hypothetical protein
VAACNNCRRSKPSAGTKLSATREARADLRRGPRRHPGRTGPGRAPFWPRLSGRDFPGDGFRAAGELMDAQRLFREAVLGQQPPTVAEHRGQKSFFGLAHLRRRVAGERAGHQRTQELLLQQRSMRLVVHVVEKDRCRSPRRAGFAAAKKKSREVRLAFRSPHRHASQQERPAGSRDQPRSRRDGCRAAVGPCKAGSGLTALTPMSTPGSQVRVPSKCNSIHPATQHTGVSRGVRDAASDGAEMVGDCVVAPSAAKCRTAPRTPGSSTTRARSRSNPQPTRRQAP